VGGTRLLRIDVELFGLSCRLRARSSDHEDVLESVRIECGPCEMYGAFALLVREMLGLSV
jgi:hypothetical protein